MVAETAKKFELLEAQAQRLMSVFIKAGHEAVAPSVIQPADVYLDVIGEALRARTYVFSDPEGEELCLRPDLTVPTCRLHIERQPEEVSTARYCYNGAAFRFQPSGANAAHPREFRQAGIETFGGDDYEQVEAETLALILEALQAAGLAEWKLRFGDLGLFRAVLASVEMPDRWRQRLQHQFWRPQAFRAELKRLTTDPAEAVSPLPEALVNVLNPDDPAESEKQVANFLDQSGIDLIGARTVAEITHNLLMRVADTQAEPLSKSTAQLIESYIAVAAPARAAGARLKDLVRDQGVDVSAALDAYHRRLQLLSEAGVDVVHADFSAEFGRTLEYYSGFVFEISVPVLGVASPVAGGGRYDGLLRMCGSNEEVAAIGAAVHTERLLAALTA